MACYRVCKDGLTGETIYETPIKGRLILEHPMLNKDAAFTKEERIELGLVGLLPFELTTLENQVKETRAAYLEKTLLAEKQFFLWTLYERNETLFYRFVLDHFEEMLPLIKRGPNLRLSKPRGIFVPLAAIDRIEEILDNVDMPDVRVIVASNEPLTRATLYTLKEGVHPGFCLPVWLDGKAAPAFKEAVMKRYPKAHFDRGGIDDAMKKEPAGFFWQPRYAPVHCTHSLQEFKRKAM